MHDDIVLCVSTALMRPRTSKQYWLKLFINMCINYVTTLIIGKTNDDVVILNHKKLE